MAKLKNTNIDSSLDAGSITVSGNEVALANHTHNIADIMTDSYLQTKVLSFIDDHPVNAHTLDNHTLSDFVLKEPGYNYTKTINVVLNPTSEGICIGGTHTTSTTPKFKVIIDDGVYELYYINGELNYEYSCVKKLKLDKWISNGFLYVGQYQGRRCVFNFDGDQPAGMNATVKVTIIADGEIPDGYIDITKIPKGNITSINNTITYMIKNTNTISRLNLDGYMYYRKETDDKSLYPVNTFVGRPITNSIYKDRTNRSLYIFNLGVSKSIILDLDNSIVVDINNGVITTNSSKPIKYNGNYISCENLSENLVFTQGVVFLTDATGISFTNTAGTATFTNNGLLYNIDMMKKVFLQKDILSTININSISYKLSDNITIPTVNDFSATINGQTLTNGANLTIDTTQDRAINASTLNGLSSDQFVKTSEVIAGTGKIARYNEQGHLIYPDGSEEWIG